MDKGSRSGSGSLLKRALMKNFQSKNSNETNSSQQSVDNNDNYNNDNKGSSTGSMHNQHGGKISLTKEEKAMIWSQCQVQVYQRLGLDWQPDSVPQM